MSTSIWILFSLVFAVISAIATFGVTRLRMEKRMAQLRQELATAQSLLESERKNVEETTRRKAFDEFLADLRVEERHYMRQQRVLFATKKSMIMQERIFFRNIPLSNWVEHEVPVEEGATVEDVMKTISVFNKALELEEGKPLRARKFLA
jgi:hypothetical protein